MVTMQHLLHLWLPTLLSAVAVFLVSWLIHMMSPWHKSDFPRIPNEDAVRNAVRPLAIPPGDYMVPRPADMAEMRSPEFAEKMVQGPVFTMTMMPNGPMSMGRNLGSWFVYLLVVSVIAGHVALRSEGVTMSPMLIFHQVTLTAFAGYALGLWQMSIWYRRAWSITVKFTLDGLIYAAITGAIFTWLWPQ